MAKTIVVTILLIALVGAAAAGFPVVAVLIGIAGVYVGLIRR